MATTIPRPAGPAPISTALGAATETAGAAWRTGTFGVAAAIGAAVGGGPPRELLEVSVGAGEMTGCGPGLADAEIASTPPGRGLGAGAGVA